VVYLAEYEYVVDIGSAESVAAIETVLRAFLVFGFEFTNPHVARRHSGKEGIGDGYFPFPFNNLAVAQQGLVRELAAEIHKAAKTLAPLVSSPTHRSVVLAFLGPNQGLDYHHHSSRQSQHQKELAMTELFLLRILRRLVNKVCVPLVQLQLLRTGTKFRPNASPSGPSDAFIDTYARRYLSAYRRWTLKRAVLVYQLLFFGAERGPLSVGQGEPSLWPGGVVLEGFRALRSVRTLLTQALANPPSHLPSLRQQWIDHITAHHFAVAWPDHWALLRDGLFATVPLPPATETKKTEEISARTVLKGWNELPLEVVESYLQHRCTRPYGEVLQFMASPSFATSEPPLCRTQ